MKPEPRLLTRSFILLVIGHLLQAAGWTTMLLLPVYVEYLGGNRSDIGSVMAIAAVGGLLFRPLTGWALDNIGRRVTLIAGTVLLTTGMFMIGFVTDIGPLIYTARFLIGVGAGALFTGYFTLAADVIPPERRTEGIALFGISGLLPLSMNGFIDRLDVAGSDMRFIFPGFAVLVLVSIWAVLAIPEPKRHINPKKEAPNPIRSLLQKKMVPVWVATMIFAGLVAVFMAFVTVTAAKQGIDHPATLWIFLLHGRSICAALRRTHSRPCWAHKYGCACDRLLLLRSSYGGHGNHSRGIYARRYPGRAWPWVLLSRFDFLVVNRIPAENRGSGLAAFTALWDVTSLLFPPLFGGIADDYGDSIMFILAVCLALLGLGIWTLIEVLTSRRARNERRIRRADCPFSTLRARPPARSKKSPRETKTSELCSQRPNSTQKEGVGS